MLNDHQIKLVQMAVKAAGIRSPGFDGRYRMLLAQYKQPNGSPVKSCRQLNNMQLDDLLAICESNGWRCPDREENFFRKKVAEQEAFASYAQKAAILHLAGDLGWDSCHLDNFIKRMTTGEFNSITALRPEDAYSIIEALKNMLSRQDGKQYSNLNQIQDEYGNESPDAPEWA